MLARLQSRQNLTMPEPRSLHLFTKKPPRNVPPPPAGTTRYPVGREGLGDVPEPQGWGQQPLGLVSASATGDRGPQPWP